VEGNSCENQALFDFNGNPLTALLEFEVKQSHAAGDCAGKVQQLDWQLKQGSSRWRSCASAGTCCSLSIVT
jgi:hypothetical protein